MAKLTIISISVTHLMELLALSFMFLYLAATPATCLSNETDFAALLAFMNAIDDDPLGALKSWNETVHFCDWKGIWCSETYPRRVVSIKLMSQRLVGSLPPHLGNLSFLREFTLGDNSFYGEIPKEFGLLRRVQFLDLSSNSFNGLIIPEIGNLTNLYVLSLSNCGFEGEIPGSLVHLRQLRSINLSNNNLLGQISREIFSLSSISISLNLAHNAFTGSVLVGSPCDLQVLDLSHNRLSGVISRDLGNCDQLGWLHLENNFLQGQIPDALVNASKGLDDLDLSQNNLSGPIPSFLGNYELKLKNLNLSFNRLHGQVPTGGVFQNENAISLQGNENLCGGLAFLRLPPCSSTTNSRKKKFSNLSTILIAALGAGAVSLALSTCIGIFLCRRLALQQVEPLVPSFPEFFLKVSYADLVKATYGFSKADFLGSGRFGSVYRGLVAGKHGLVAVKVLNLEIKGASESFTSECNAIKGIRHRNLLNILSVCESVDFHGNSFMALVYEFMAKGSLDKWLHNESIRNLSIAQKLNIAMDVATAVEYLHHGTDSIIIHGDLKPSNILLDENMTAHVGDFGLAKVVSNIYPVYDGSSSSVAIKGTLGYIPPEYGITNSMTTQGDVYSFGILVLEMFTNIRPTDDVALRDQPSLHHLVSHALRSQEMNIVDQIIPREYRDNPIIRNCVTYLLEVGVACSQPSPKDRMTITDVVSELYKIRIRNGEASHSKFQKLTRNMYTQS
ncbi:putative receptor-like protein kinase At3g47110 [Henckelia pumila]|uniref:putative receptor-like protein kinase At3g47110 n=1 Tax=Henckelia pumila TaxID=405737 RepID=UPI003C6E6BB4